MRVLNSFFVVRGARREGVGLRAVREVVGRHPSWWEVACQYDTTPRSASGDASPANSPPDRSVP
ncbi:hypothetical protein ACFV29_35635 [Streptomyces sp. NPDC059690]|uniref:hypothetical protein n=1 Tax=Streptomyces sp. NPDC059690 TaxID=3346907 RepID=UPI003695A187